jgi:hypothetical protein
MEELVYILSFILQSITLDIKQVENMGVILVIKVLSHTDPTVVEGRVSLFTLLK